jgi:hypothetical protein
MNNDKELIDQGTYYEIKDYEPIVNRDENGNKIETNLFKRYYKCIVMLFILN